MIIDELIYLIPWFFIIVLVIGLFIYKVIIKKENTATANYKASITLEKAKSKDEIIDSLQKSGFKKITHDPTTNTYNAITGFSMSSFTENIEVKHTEQDGKQQLHFKSTCGLPTQVVAWGKNKRNYKKFAKNITH